MQNTHSIQLCQERRCRSSQGCEFVRRKLGTPGEEEAHALSQPNRPQGFSARPSWGLWCHFSDWWTGGPKGGRPPRNQLGHVLCPCGQGTTPVRLDLCEIRQRRELLKGRVVQTGQARLRLRQTVTLSLEALDRDQLKEVTSAVVGRPSPHLARSIHQPKRRVVADRAPVRDRAHPTALSRLVSLREGTSHMAAELIECPLLLHEGDTDTVA